MGWAPWEHGTDNGYTNHHCRCYWCKQARSLYAEQWRERSGIPEHVHGSYNGYTNYLCRCEGCRQAYSETKAAAYLRRKNSPRTQDTPPPGRRGRDQGGEKMESMIGAMNYLRGWEGRAGWRTLFVSLVQSWLVMGALMMSLHAFAFGWRLGYLYAAGLAMAAAPLLLTFCTNWRFDLRHYMRVVDRR